MKRTFSLILIVLFVLAFFVGCSKDLKADDNVVIEEPNQNNEDKLIEDEKAPDTEAIPEETQDIDPKEKIDLSLKPNEAGQIMVLMYHNIGEEESEWVRTAENFKKDLRVLYEKGYRPISLKDFVNNNINVEAGYTPVVITFDDGNQNNFNIIEKDGEKIVDPNCAVGILEEFNREHPDFPLKATFFVFGSNPFRQRDLLEYKLNYLIEKGFDIGNHTLDHNDMSKANEPDKIQKYIGEQAAFIEGIIPGYKVNTYALCYGGRPKDKELYSYLEKGEYEGNTYKNIAILNVGWDPSVSPIDKAFNPLAIHRIRASETKVDGVGMYDWLSVFDKHPERRFISDGNPDIVTVPKKLEDKVDIEKLKGKELYIYEE
ncbi:Polysaccharide deacetylase [Proteiniborus ethanoligenes]|uniref:Polysaccharide deacetylase n=1 Tax=Proteiniborus ethanoligenes TaxID=415015 RepID=A0A1H3PA48_9FIRM|nr:polysaccharide deacetylase family protein [Proteiniborus ethanoligenes]SDY97930.1 Polysaccharide deacetylase [Proteiniborus ethanoligenes]